MSWFKHNYPPFLAQFLLLIKPVARASGEKRRSLARLNGASNALPSTKARHAQKMFADSTRLGLPRPRETMTQ